MNSFLEFFKDSLLIKIIIAIILFLFHFISNAQESKNSELYQILKSKDSIIFENAFNTCNFKELETIISNNFEFYHDVGGIQNKKQFFKTVKENICPNPDNFARNLVENSLEVFPMKKNGQLYGAIQKGKHTFQEKQNGKLTTIGIADFTHLWILENKIWKLKRVLSYNHKPYSN
ncbi:nuclear transport factor 2 family protein [Polaribacter batillariae]|uniref:Nuclear transport factor 2 family protein n=1 Tax=Polaribacter batillariae TaxID=2808900 RepID=A0ABX7SVF7_9FLAO|nr:nuclear transport factor 2 family protein [Polaribacter batillariae]QTD38227.1 nuclear transport factor 2 family protein [Polaribacter batillariae]